MGTSLAVSQQAGYFLVHSTVLGPAAGKSQQQRIGAVAGKSSTADRRYDRALFCL